MKKILAIVVLYNLGGMVGLMSQETNSATITEKTAAEQINPPTATKESKEATDSFEKLLQRELDGVDTTQQEQPSWAWQVFKTTFVLGLLIAVFYFLYRIYVFKQKLPGIRATALKLHYEFPLAQGKSLQIVELGNRLLVLGLSESGVNLLTEITDRAQIEKIILDCEKDNSQEKPDFFMELSRALSRKTADLFKGGGSQFVQTQTPETWDTWRSATMSRLEKLKSERDRLREKE